MKISKISFLLLFFISALSFQNKNISIELIFDDQLKAKALKTIHLKTYGPQYVIRLSTENAKMKDFIDKQVGDRTNLDNTINAVNPRIKG